MGSAPRSSAVLLLTGVLVGCARAQDAPATAPEEHWKTPEQIRAEWAELEARGAPLGEPERPLARRPDDPWVWGCWVPDRGSATDTGSPR